MTVADQTLLEMFETMMTIRLFEERVTLEYQRGDMPGFVHTYIGAEAVATGVCAHLSDDRSHRQHASGPRAQSRQGMFDLGDARRAVRPRDGLVQGPGRIDAHRRLRDRDAGSQRDRRREHRPRHRRGLRPAGQGYVERLG